MSSIDTRSPHPYHAVLAQLESIPWSLAPDVTPIEPQNRTSLDFFPGHRGYSGAQFPVGGIMVVGNNFSSVKGWADYCASADSDSTTRTWRNLRVIVDAAGFPIDRYWFTNYCLGVLERDGESYDFPARLVRALQFKRVFEASVEAMRPSVVVTLGKAAARHLSTDYKRRVDIEVRTIGTHQTRLLAVVHPSAWTWDGRGFREEDFRREGERIREAAALAITA